VKYILITAARNEEAFIEKTLLSVTNQTVLPERWIIVDDGSTDRTAAIAEGYAKRLPWIEVIRLPHRRNRNFAGKVYAFNTGLERAEALGLRSDVIGNLDADISFDPDHMEFLTRKFLEDPQLGVAGTPFTQTGYDSADDSFEGQNHVAGQCQLFRYRCFQDIGGYVPNPAGGIDWIAVTSARMKGWKTRSFPEKRYHHYRAMGTAERTSLAALFSYGEKDYYLGGSPVWEIFRVCYRGTKRPVLIGGLVLFAGYCWAVLRRADRPVTRELMRFHRREQMRKLRAILGALLRRGKVDNFRLAID
jgi:biofilm PGA synthesis N-glycosyltransferase PgaC